MNNRLLSILVLLGLLAILLSACASIPGRAAENGALTASGTVSARQVAVAPEIGGKVVAVLVEEGQSVKTGDVLFHLDDALLQAQREQATAAVQVAEATLESAHVGLETTKANAKAELLPAQQALDQLYKNAGLARAAAEQGMAAANRAVRETTYQLDNYIVPTEQKGMTAVEAVKEMKKRLDQAREDFEPYKFYSSSDPIREDLKDALDQAQSDYDAAVRRLEYETAVEQAQARLDKAVKDLEALKNGPDPDDVAALEARIAAIEAAPKQAEAAIQQAEAGLTQAQAALNAINVQIAKLTVTSPINGVLLTRNLEVGETVSPGSTLMTIGQLDEVELVVYIPEDRYGEINLGEEAEIQVDSFPGETFNGAVAYISDQAEFSPRNVQTVEGRRATVYAVKLLVPNPDLKLKPGMPADVTFNK